MTTTADTRAGAAGPVAGDESARFGRSLGGFFRAAARISWRDPGLALVFARAAARQRKAATRRQEWRELGVQVPPLLIVSVTRRCNLHCVGCFVQAQGLLEPVRDEREGRMVGVADEAAAAAGCGGARPGEMTAGEFRTLFAEAVDLGVAVVALAGGEPLTRPEVLEVAGEFPELTFLLVTNGSLLDERLLDTLARHRHIIPLLSLEGVEAATDERRGRGAFARATAAMQALKARGLFFGTSIMVTRPNFGQVTSRTFVRDLVARGSRLFFYVDYVPIQAGTERLVPTETQRSAEALSILLLRREFPALFLASAVGEQAYGGCLAAGRGFVHVNPEGGVEPCPFSPFSDVDARRVGLKRALQSGLLSAIRDSGSRLSEAEGGCALWNRRDWLEGLLASTDMAPDRSGRRAA